MTEAMPTLELPAGTTPDGRPLLEVLRGHNGFNSAFFTIHRSKQSESSGLDYARTPEEAAGKIESAWRDGLDVTVEITATDLPAPNGRSARLLTDGEWLNDVAPDQIVDGLIYRGSTHNLTGASKVGKSWIAYQLAACVVSGAPFLGLNVKQSSVLLVSLEMAAGMVRERMNKIEKDIGIPMPEIGLGFHVVAPTADYLPRLDLSSEDGFDTLEGLILDSEAELCILDTLYRFLPGVDPNDNGEMGTVFGRMNELAQTTGCAILLLDHVAKGEQLGPVSHSALGASVKGGASRVIIGLKRTSKEGGGRWELNVESHFGSWDEVLYYQRPELSDGTYGSGCILCTATEGFALDYDTLKALFEQHAPPDGDGRPCFMSKRKLIGGLRTAGRATGNHDGNDIVRAIEKDFCVPESTKSWGENRPILTRDGPRRSLIFTWRGLPEPDGRLPI